MLRYFSVSVVNLLLSIQNTIKQKRKKRLVTAYVRVLVRVGLANVFNSALTVGVTDVADYCSLYNF